MAEEKIAGTVSEETAVEKKSSKPAKKEKKAQGSRVLKYFRDLKGEFAKITWPTLPAVIRNTLVTLAMCAIVAVIVCLVDIGLSALVDWMLSL